jgi:hypothetical protein
MLDLRADSQKDRLSAWARVEQVYGHPFKEPNSNKHHDDRDDHPHTLHSINVVCIQARVRADV